MEETMLEPVVIDMTPEDDAPAGGSAQGHLNIPSVEQSSPASRLWARSADGSELPLAVHSLPSAPLRYLDLQGAPIAPAGAGDDGDENTMGASRTNEAALREEKTAQGEEEAPVKETAESPSEEKGPDYGPLLARYPGFNPDTDGADPSFTALVAAGVPTDKAYEVLHMDDLLLGAMEYASRRTLERLAGSALAGRSRPAENGLAAGQPAQTALDPRTMTRQQFKDLKERVYRGEKVYL